MNQFLAAIATGQGGSLKPTSWSDVQALVRKGLASKVFAVGDQLTCQRGSTTLVWDIIGFDIDTPADKQFTHSMTLQLHEVFDFVQFNAPAAMYYAEEELAAGTYHVTPKNGWSGGMGNGKTYQFTLAKAVPKGGQIVWNGAWDQDPLKYDIKTYASPTSTTVIETVKPTEGTGGTELTTLNSGQRMCYGSNNYKESAVRGWLNSDKVAGSVWTPATNYDRPPSWVSNKAGFMNGMDADFLAVIGKTTKVTCRNNVTDGGGSDTTKDKFFLLSRRELFMGDEVSSVKEGEPYPYYSDYSDYTSPNTGADSNRVKYKNGSPQWQWERTPYAGYSGYVRFVRVAGGLNKQGTEGWVLKADLKNFFGSTSHELAYSAVTKRVNDEWVNGEIKRIIDSFNQGDDPEVGMGLGSETTQLIQLAVLDDFDHFIKEQLHIKHYVRYNDDFIIIHVFYRIPMEVAVVVMVLYTLATFHARMYNLSVQKAYVKNCIGLWLGYVVLEWIFIWILGKFLIKKVETNEEFM